MMIYRSVPFSMVLNDPWPRFHGHDALDVSCAQQPDARSDFQFILMSHFWNTHALFRILLVLLVNTLSHYISYRWAFMLVNVHVWLILVREFLGIFALSGGIFKFQNGNSRWPWRDGNPPNGGVECRWGRQKSRFWAYIWLDCLLLTL